MATNISKGVDSLIMKKLLKKSIITLGLTACTVGAISASSFASFSFDSYATTTGSGGRWMVTAYTAQTNEPFIKSLHVSAQTNDGTYQSRNQEASPTDQVTLIMTTAGAATNGTSWHDWVSAVDEANRTKSINFR